MHLFLKSHCRLSLFLVFCLISSFFKLFSENLSEQLNSPEESLLKIHSLVQKKMGFYSIHLPSNYKDPLKKNKKYPLCLLLHDKADSELSWKILVDAFPDDIIFIMPRAPHPHIKLFLDAKISGWTLEANQPASEKFQLIPARSETKKELLHKYIFWLKNCLEDATKRYDIDPNRIIVIGKGQGAVLAHHLALSEKKLIWAYLAYAGNFSENLLAQNTDILKKHHIQAILVHHRGDLMVPLEKTMQLERVLTRNAVPHQQIFLKGPHHELSAPVLHEMKKFIHDFFPEISPSKPIENDRLKRLFITYVHPDSKADLAGFLPYDILLSYGNVPVYDIEKFRRLIRTFIDSPAVSIKVLRKNKILNFQVSGGHLGFYLAPTRLKKIEPEIKP
jgi:phospholipase/carboxylesterase